MDRSAAAANDRTRLETMKAQMAQRSEGLTHEHEAMREAEQRLVSQCEDAARLLEQEEAKQL